MTPFVFSVSAFRTAFPEFKDTQLYPDQMITFWSQVPLAQVNKSRWCNMYGLGFQLYLAHELVIAGRDRKSAEFGGVPGTSGGIATDKTVGSVSVGYDAQSTTEKDAGYWNQTTYGKQFIRLARLFGAGAIQLIGCRPIIVNGNFG